MIRKHRVLLLIPALVGLSGCHGMVGGRTPEEQQALDKVSIQSALESDRAGVIFAQKTLELVQKQSLERPTTPPVNPERRLARAKADLFVAQTMYKLTQERQQTFSEYMAWKDFAKSAIMAEAAQDPE